jgi:hypothetical protein
MLGRHESMRATSEFSTRSTSKPQPIGHTIKIAPTVGSFVSDPMAFHRIALQSLAFLQSRAVQPAVSAALLLAAP